MDYDFGSLNDKEFEIFCADLVGAYMQRRFERFKRGRDGGVDGRYFAANGLETVLQCKHRPATPIEKLISHLKAVEVLKVARLKPTRYVLALSTPVSRRDKSELVSAFAPFLQREDDVFGREDLNDILSKYPEIERRHYKLWLASTGVLAHLLNKAIYERSEFALSQMIEGTRMYVHTTAHEQAKSILEKHRVVIVAGEPGIGKTMLAEQLCLSYVAAGYSLLMIGNSIDEVEAVFDRDAKQIFYFDDFLGRNYLEALTGHEGTAIVRFIEMVRKGTNKIFVLTSRSTILNQGKLLMDTLRHQNIDKHEYVLNIDSLTELDRAKILYNHIWFSTLPDEYVEELYIDRRYREIIRHKNYNPRLIRFITDRQRLVGCSAERYWHKVQESLKNPADIWENPFQAQEDDFGRAIVLLVTVNRKAIPEHELGIAFSRFLAFCPSLRGGSDFIGTLQRLTGSLLSRTIGLFPRPIINLFNPAIGDYVLRRYSGDVPSLVAASISLRSGRCLETLEALRKDGIISSQVYADVITKLADIANEDGFVGYEDEYLSVLLCALVHLIGEKKEPPSWINAALEVVLNGEHSADCSAAASLLEWALSKDKVSPLATSGFVERMAEESRGENELIGLNTLFGALPRDIEGHKSAHDRLRDVILYHISDTLLDTVNEAELMSSVDYGDHETLEQLVSEHIEERLGAFSNITFDVDAGQEMLQDFDAEDELEKFHRKGTPDYYGDRIIGSPSVSYRIDDIDDLFDRS